MAKKKGNKKSRGETSSYKSENRKFIHKVNRLSQRLKHYKTQPPKILKGFNDALSKAVEAKIKNLRNE